uniref:Uncharacterized protein n=1 Tax=Arundo donax TaxID=35708 RepID=A0A0A9HTT8_ARUDO
MVSKITPFVIGESMFRLRIMVLCSELSREEHHPRASPLIFHVLPHSSAGT